MMNNETITSYDGESLEVQVATNLLTYLSMVGLSGTVEFKQFRQSILSPGVVVGLFCQFVMLPLTTYICVLSFDVNSVSAVSMLLTATCPGGVFSNLFCTVFNSDLSLSVAMTTYSTFMSFFMLPLNVLLYVELALELGEDNIAIDWLYLFITVVVVILGVITGLGLNYKFKEYRNTFNALGVFGGVGLAFVAAFGSGGSREPFWEQTAATWGAIISPMLINTGIALSIAACFGRRISKPERSSVVVEVTYQNTAIATSIIYGTFPLSVANVAVGIPLSYSIVSTFLDFFLLHIFWKLGWSHAPADEKYCKFLVQNYQPIPTSDQNIYKIESNETESI